MKTLRDRLYTKFIPHPRSGCWVWTGAVSDRGYGRMWDKYTYEYAHRASFRFHYGDIQEGMFICHRCDNPLCINPEHLFIGTAEDNFNDMVSKGRSGLWKEVLKGEQLTKRGLSDADIREIRSSTDSQIAISKRYGISRAMTSMIRSRQRWKHV